MSTETGLVNQARCGCYGKLPAVGDFVSYHLPSDFVEPWDSWLQQVMLAGKDNLQERWLDAYLTCPIYRFLCAPGVLGEADNGWIGVMVPSLDRVGRYFPLMICAPLESDVNICTLSEQYQAWFVAVEEVLLACLDTLNIEQLKGRLVDLDQLLIKSQEKSQTPSVDNEIDPLNRRFSLNEKRDMAALYPSFLSTLFFDGKCGCLWWTEGSEQVAASCVVSREMPTAKKATAFFDGEWQRWGWQV